MFIRFGFGHRSKTVKLGEEEFTATEVKRLGALRRQYLTYPDSFRLEVNYKRAHFVRWLVQRGYLREGLERREEAAMSAYLIDKWRTIQRWT